MARKLADTVVVLIIMVTAVGTLGYRKVYGTWWPRTPDRLTYCGRTYETNHTLVLSRAGVSERRSSLIREAPYPVVTVGRVPPVVGRSLLAAVTPEATRQRFDPPLPCAMGVYLKTGADAYTGYGILGGP